MSDRLSSSFWKRFGLGLGSFLLCKFVGVFLGGNVEAVRILAAPASLLVPAAPLLGNGRGQSLPGNLGRSLLLPIIFLALLVRVLSRVLRFSGTLGAPPLVAPRLHKAVALVVGPGRRRPTLANALLGTLQPALKHLLLELAAAFASDHRVVRVAAARHRCAHVLDHNGGGRDGSSGERGRGWHWGLDRRLKETPPGVTTVPGVVSLVLRLVLALVLPHAYGLGSTVALSRLTALAAHRTLS
mmetsp:Transcript_12979/g.24743  ORF Transcript_12979/g.24743 Transcript_12979/m.24743 type:complete len:242 (-) Transcript_12979:1163-1888(-)